MRIKKTKPTKKSKLTPKPSPPRPVELREARNPPTGEDERDAHGYCRKISSTAGRDDYHWGFRIYRTAYRPACVDDDFNRAVEVLHEYMKYSCFEDIKYNASGAITNASDDKPEQQLWKLLRNEIVQDPEQLNGASPSTIKPLALKYIASRGAKVAESSRYRFVLIIDAEVVRNLLSFPVPVIDCPDRNTWYSVKFLDVEFYSSLVDYEQNYEGWAWAAGWRLLQAWCLCRDMDALEIYTFDDNGSPMQSETAI